MGTLVTAQEYFFVPFSGSNLTPGQRAINTTMSKSCVTFEWYFREIKRYWAFVDFKRMMKLKESAVGMLYIAVVLLTNARNCLHVNAISQYFHCAPLALEEYMIHRDDA